MAAGQRASVIAAANRAVAAAHVRGDAVIAIGNAFRRGDLMNVFRRFAAVAGSDGARWDERVATNGAPYFAKWRGSAFCNAGLAAWLETLGVRTLALAGVYAGACISATALDGLARGYRIAVLSDAVADRSDAARQRALERLRRAGAAIAESAADFANGREARSGASVAFR